MSPPRISCRCSSVQRLRSLDCFFSGLRGFGHVVQLFDRYFLAAALQVHGDFVGVRTYLGHGLVHHFGRPVAQLDALFLDLFSGILSGLRRQ
jgi:hypothetical protein